MRLPIKHLHRAFPELDGYSDEQCLRFIHASRGSTRRERLIRALIHLFIIGLINVVCFLAGAAFLFWIAECAFSGSPLIATGPRMPLWEAIAVMLVLTAVVAVGPILGFIARDFLVIDRVRWILRSRGLCSTCRYSLVGLAVSADNHVTCPECATTTDVDASLGELTIDEAGRPRFRPDVAEHVKAPLIARTPEAIKTLLRIARAACIAVAAIMVLGLLGGEVFLRVQAASVRRDRPTAATIRAHIEAGQPPGTSAGEPDAAEVGTRLVAMIRATEREVTQRHRETSETVPSAAYWYVGMSDDRLGNVASDLEDARMSRAFAIECIRAMEADGVFDVAAEFAACRRVSGEVQDPLDLQQLFGSGIDRWTLGQVFGARAHLAIADRDGSDLVRAVEWLLATARISSMQFGLGYRFFGQQSEAQAYSLVNEAALAGMLDRDTASALLDAFDRQSFRPPLAWNAEWDRLCALVEIASVFESAPGLRLGPWSAKGKELKKAYTLGGGGAAPAGRIGTYKANVRAIDAYQRYAQSALNAEYDEGMALAIGRPGLTGLIIPDHHGFPIERLIWLEVQNALNREGVRLVLCVERFRCAHGRLPERLEELVPEFIDELPRDVWGEGRLVFVRVDPSTDPFGRAYLIYSIGADETDDGGRSITGASERQRLLWAPMPPELRGFDYVINTPGKDGL